MFPEFLDFDNAIEEIENEDELLYNETSFLYDFKEGDFIYKNGNPVLVKGVEAIKIWIEKALRTRIYTYDIYDETDEDGLLKQREYGTNIWQIVIGRKLPPLVVHAETLRDVEETLSYNDKIKRIEDYEIELGNQGKSYLLKISFTVVLVDGTKFPMEVND